MFLAALLFSFAACVDRGDPTAPGASNPPTPVATGNVAKVDVKLPVASLEVGNAANAAAVAMNSAGQPVQSDTIQWSSSDSSIVAVSSAGVVTARRMGSASVWATCHGVSGKGALVVTDTSPAKIVVSPSTAAAAVGATVQLSAAISTRTGRPLPNHAVKWTSTDTRYVTVSTTGLVMGRLKGSAKIIATASKVADTAIVDVASAHIAALNVVPHAATVPSGKQLSLTASALDAQGNSLSGRAVSWTSSNSKIATISTTGVVTAAKSGVATITATSEGVTAASRVHVTTGGVSVVSLVPSSVGLASGATQQLTVTLTDVGGNVLPAASMRWATSDKNVATVSNSGVVTARRAGSATVSASVSGVTGQASVIVSAAGIKSIAISPSSFTLVSSGTRQLSASLTDASGNAITGQAVAWSSSNSSVATVSSSGMVTAVHSGSASITASAGGASASAAVTVSAGSVSTVSVSPGSASLVAGATQQLAANLTDASGSSVTGQTVTWASSNTAIVSVSSTGVATAGQVGSATVTATAGGVSGQSTITVAAGALANVTITPASGTVQQGKTMQLSASFTDVAGNPVPATSLAWTSSNAADATVNSTGLVTGMGAGTANVTATANGKSKSAPITVTAVSAPTLSSLTLSPGSVSLAAGAKQTFTVGATWSDGSTTAPTVSYTATGGSITSTGVYTAGTTAGNFRVVAQSGSKADSSVVTITAPTTVTPTLTAVTVSPGSTTLPPRGSAQFKAVATYSNGSTATPVVAYSATGGSISPTGMYTAGSTPGTFHVIATDSAKADTSTVTITAAVVQSADCPNPTSVSSVTELTSALSQAVAGQCIQLAPGTYTLGSSLSIARGGTSSSPVIVEGSGSNTIIDVNQKYMFLDASYVHLRKLRLTNFNSMGFWLRGVTGDVIDSVEIDHTLQEAFAFKNGSKFNVIKNSLIHDTGISNGQYGEGVYVGGKLGTAFDSATDNQILYNHIGPNVRAEGVDIKEGADRTTVRGNTFDGTGEVFINYATTSVVAVVGSYALLDSNYISPGNPHGVSFIQGAGPMRGNVASRNTIDLQQDRTGMSWSSVFPTASTILGFQLQTYTYASGIVIKCDNVMLNGGRLTNNPNGCTP